MTSVPRSALLLGLAGLLPFAWGVVTMLYEPLTIWTIRTLGPRFVAPFVLLNYGSIILAFMSGVLWGFATRADAATAPLAYGLSVLPALWAFFFVGAGPEASAINLIAGYIGLLMLDWTYARQGLAPTWWMSLRIPLTLGVIACLATVAL